MQTVEKLNREKGITVVLITHHMDEAAQAQRVIVLDKGKVAADGNAQAGVCPGGDAAQAGPCGPGQCGAVLGFAAKGL